MEIIREFQPADRYVYDFDLCSCDNGFAQVDTREDASYFGIWANPEKFIIFSYCEGDCTTTICDDKEEFIAELTRIKDFYGDDFKGVDPGLKKENIAKWFSIGLQDLLH